MAAAEYQLLKEGFLDIKVPRGSHDRKFIKAWKRMWVSVLVYLPVRRGEPHLILYLSKKSEEAPEKKVKTPRDNLHLFRCRSGSRPFGTWALSSGNTLLLYLAAETELQAQQWMQVMRNGLWPPLSPFQMLKPSHDVSLIDDEKTFAAGLLGIYGSLTLTNDDTISVLHSHWGGILLRLPLADIQEIHLLRTAGSENPKAGVFSVLLCSKPNTGLKTFQFYSFSAVEVVDWLHSLTNTEDSNEILESSEINKVLLPNLNSETLPVLNTGCEYAIVRKNTAISTEQDQIPSISVQDDSIYGEIEPKGVLNQLGNIPGDFLNASISSIRPSRADTEESSSSTEDENSTHAPWIADDAAWTFENVYEHIYEELESRRGTLYEEIDPPESEYIPPLPPVTTNPPRVPARDLKNLRLLKLSESVTEALKLAETPPPASPTTPSWPQKKPLVKFKSDLYISAQTETSEGMETDAAPERRKRLSVPDISDSMLYVNALPLVAFNTETDKKPSAQPISGNGAEMKHPSLKELLQSLNPKSVKKAPVPKNSFARRKSSGKDLSDVEYIDMRHTK